MKKYLIFVAGISLLFFSCASKPEESDSIVLNLGKGTSDNSTINEIGSPELKTEDIGQAPDMTGEIGLNSGGSNDIGDLSSFTDISGQFETTDDTASENPNISSELEENADDVEATENKNNSETELSLDDEINMLADPEVIDLEYVEESAPVTLQPAENNNEAAETLQQDNVSTEENSSVLSSTENEKSKTEKNSDSVKPVKKPTTVEQDDDDIIDLTENNSSDDILEILDPDSDAFPEETEPVIIIPSRKVTLKIGQTLEVMYPGSGWIYMGTTDSTKDFTFLGKKLGTQNTKFKFTAKAEGTKILHFYKNDALTENYIDDYLEVEILKDKDTAKTTIPAPAYKNPVPKKVIKEPVTKTESEPQKQTEIKPVDTIVESKKVEPKTETTPAVTKPQATPVEQKNTVAKEVEKTPVVSAPAKSENTKTENTKTETAKQEFSESEVLDLLKQAHNLYDTKEYKSALNKLAQFFEFSTRKRDEAFFLQGQIYEADSSVKNIKLAIEAYRNVTKNYPASPYWDDANKRIIYLTKFYLEGR